MIYADESPCLILYLLNNTKASTFSDLSPILRSARFVQKMFLVRLKVLMGSKVVRVCGSCVLSYLKIRPR